MATEDHKHVLKAAAEGRLPEEISVQSEFPVSTVKELYDAGYLTATDASSDDGDVYLEPRITLAGRQYLNDLDAPAPEQKKNIVRESIWRLLAWIVGILGSVAAGLILYWLLGSR